MGRKKQRPAEEENAPRGGLKKPKKPIYDDDYDDEPEIRHWDIDPDVQELAHAFGIDAGLTQKLNDVMMGSRQRSWEQDLERLYEILKDARSPSAMLALKVRDMENGTFVGKARCGTKVREMAHRFNLDRGASQKLEEAMAMREAMGKNVEKDLELLAEHLEASNKPSALISMKLGDLRRGLSVGHCIYSREPPLPGNTAPGIEGVFDKRRGRGMGYTDKDLEGRFATAAVDNTSGGSLMDEATAKRLIAAEREEFEASKGRSRTWSRSCSPKKKRKSSRRRSKSRSKSRSVSRSRSCARSRSCSRCRSRSCSSNSSSSRGPAQRSRAKSRSRRKRRR